MSGLDLESIRRRLLEEAKSSVSVFWVPQQEGEYLFGEVLDVYETTITARGETITTRVALIKSFDDDEIYQVALLSKTLARLWDAKNVEVGDIVLILYKGQRTSADGTRTYNLYGLGVYKREERQEHVVVSQRAPTEQVVAQPQAETTISTPQTTQESVVSEEVSVTEEAKEVVPQQAQQAVGSAVLQSAVNYILDMLEFYEEGLTRDEIEELLRMRGLSVGAEDVIGAIHDKIVEEDGKIRLRK